MNAQHAGLSASQSKAQARVLEANPEGFAGGMSTEKCVNLIGVSRATAYRKLTQLTVLEQVKRTGQRRGTRYALVNAKLLRVNFASTRGGLRMPSESASLPIVGRQIVL
ncbi:MAG TPA: hypothetical protein VNT59_18585, partial [Ramlibacter sp.]|nr:hypothetical protein [Ramlibacter sp.]